MKNTRSLHICNIFDTYSDSCYLFLRYEFIRYLCLKISICFLSMPIYAYFVKTKENKIINKIYMNIYKYEYI